MFEVNYLDDVTTLTLRTERQVAGNEANNFFDIIRRAYIEISGLSLLQYEEDEYPDEPGNTGFRLTFATADREWQEFHKYESELEFRLMDGEFGNSIWPKSEFNLIAAIRNTFTRLHFNYEIISFGSGDNSP